MEMKDRRQHLQDYMMEPNNQEDPVRDPVDPQLYRYHSDLNKVTQLYNIASGRIF
jgi:DNA-binding protein Fis